MSAGRKNIMLGTAGHVDHGKTALVKLLTGCETDTLAEEKQRGLTIDLGFAPCRLSDERIVGVVDVPGHVDFIRNMVAGAHGIDVVIFVVAADDGIMPQTHEHLHILTLMGLRHGLVALTKIDLVEPSRRESVVQELRNLLAGTFLAEAPICPMSNITGEGFDTFFDSLNQIANACDERPTSGVFRLWVEDVFTIRGAGTVITGIPTHGKIQLGESLTLLPTNTTGRVRRLQVYGAEATEARAGECVALNIPELDHLSVRRGMLLCATNAIEPVTMIEGELHVLNSMRSKLEDYFEAHLHIGTASSIARVAMLEKPEMGAGDKQMVQLRLSEPLAVAPGVRFVLRANLPALGQSGMTTIGGGLILSTSNTKLRRNKAWTLDPLKARREAITDPARWCELLIKESRRPLKVSELQTLSLLRAEELSELVTKLCANNVLRRAQNECLIHSDTVRAVADKIISTIEAFHSSNPQNSGITREQLCATLNENAEVLELAIQDLIATKKIECTGAVLSRFGWSARLSNADQQLCDKISNAFQRAGWTSPSVADLSATLHEPPDKIQKSMRLLAERAILVRLDEQLFMHSDAVELAKQIAVRMFAQKPGFSTMEFRDKLGVSRKFAVPLLDHLDRLRFTVRNGHDRTPGVEARKLLKR